MMLLRIITPTLGQSPWLYETVASVRAGVSGSRMMPAIIGARRMRAGGGRGMPPRARPPLAAGA